MTKRKVTKKVEKIKLDSYNIEDYDLIIGIEWSNDNCTIAILKRNSRDPQIKVLRSDIREVKEYFENLGGKKIATIEETTTSQWLYVELREVIDRIVICDPYKNKLLSTGPKTDKIDAKKLSILLKGYNISEVFHTTDEKYKLRKLVSSYEDVIKSGVRLLNQQSALLRAEGKVGKGTEGKKDKGYIKFINDHQKKGINLYQQTKEEFSLLFHEEWKKDKIIRILAGAPGIGEIGAVKIVATVITPERFKNTGKYEAYCGLVKHIMESGKKSYGNRSPRYSRRLKAVYKTAAMAALKGNNAIREYYEYLRGKGIAEHNARNAVSRYICRITYGMMKSGEKYDPYRWRKTNS